MLEAQVRVAGALSGAVFLTANVEPAGCESPWDVISVGQLRAEVKRLIGDRECQPVLVVSGRRLLDDTLSLASCNIGPATKVLILRGATKEASVSEPSGSQDLDRIWRAAEAMGSRHAASTSNGMLLLEDQNGGAFKFGRDEDRKALIMGLTLHQKGQASLKRRDFQQASKELLLAERAMDMVSMDSLGIRIDNKALLLIDLVWCWLKIQDRSYLASASKRLEEARRILARSHGEDQERLRVLHGDFCPELATYVRLELLEGAALFYQGALGDAKKKLESAKAKWQRLTVSDEALAQLTLMGFTVKEASRALRFSSGDVNSAVECVMKHRQAQTEARKRDEEFRKRLKSQRRIGKTSSGQPVDMDHLDFLVSSGHDRNLAAEALRLSDNDQWAALDILSNELSSTQLQISMADKLATRKKARKKTPASKDRKLGEAADQAADALLAGSVCTGAGAGGTSDDLVEANDAGPGEEQSDVAWTEERVEDEEMEGILAAEVKSDPMDAYDVDLNDEGESILEYLAKVESMDPSAGG